LRFIHISDLHLGKRVNEFSMLEDQAYILKEILTIIAEEKPDAVLIAGDVYDRSVPPEEAVALWDDFLVQLAKSKTEVFAISGNHDSAVRFADHSALVSSTGIHLAPKYDGEAMHVRMTDDFGEVMIYLLPFVKPVDVRKAFPEEEITDYTDACRIAIDKMQIDTQKRNVLVAHQFVTGATRCESEEIVVGGLDNVDASVFDPFDYVALGHLHGKQKVGRETLRYSGTPLKYSFSEKNHVKSVTIVEMGEKGDITVRERVLKPKHDLREIRGTYEKLIAKEAYEGTAVDDYIHAILTDEQDVVDAFAKLRIVYRNLMKVSYDNARTRGQQSVAELSNVEKKSPLEIFSEFYEQQNNSPLNTEQEDFMVECMKKVWEE